MVRVKEDNRARQLVCCGGRQGILWPEFWKEPSEAGFRMFLLGNKEAERLSNGLLIYTAKR